MADEAAGSGGGTVEGCKEQQWCWVEALKPSLASDEADGGCEGEMWWWR